MSHPIFRYFSENRNVSEQHIFWRDIEKVKKYPGADIIHLDKPSRPEGSIASVLEQRQTAQDFKNKKFSIQSLAHVLYWSLNEQVSLFQDTSLEFVRRPYPSGGAKFPIDVYVLADKQCGAELESGVFHYRVDTHVLEKVARLDSETIQTIKNSYLYPCVNDIPILLLFTYIRERNIPKYGYLGEKLAILEAGHMAQNIILVSTEKGFQTKPLAGGDSELIEKTCGFDSYNESVFYSLGLSE